MPDLLSTNPFNLLPEYDRRRKLSDAQREEIRVNPENLSINGLARKYGVNKRLIQFIKFPERLEKNKELRAIRGGSAIYYDREKHTTSAREHRKYKRTLVGI